MRPLLLPAMVSEMDIYLPLRFTIYMKTAWVSIRCGQATAHVAVMKLVSNYNISWLLHYCRTTVFGEQHNQFWYPGEQFWHPAIRASGWPSLLSHQMTSSTCQKMCWYTFAAFPWLALDHMYSTNQWLVKYDSAGDKEPDVRLSCSSRWLKFLAWCGDPGRGLYLMLYLLE